MYSKLKIILLYITLVDWNIFRMIGTILSSKTLRTRCTMLDLPPGMFNNPWHVLIYLLPIPIDMAEMLIWHFRWWQGKFLNLLLLYTLYLPWIYNAHLWDCSFATVFLKFQKSKVNTMVITKLSLLMFSVIFMYFLWCIILLLYQH